MAQGLQALGSTRQGSVHHADCGRAVQRYGANSLDVVHLAVRAGVTGVRVRGWGVTPADCAFESSVSGTEERAGRAPVCTSHPLACIVDAGHVISPSELGPEKGNPRRQR